MQAAVCKYFIPFLSFESLVPDDGVTGSAEIKTDVLPQSEMHLAGDQK